jgi:predicted nucleotidyltransferase
METLSVSTYAEKVATISQEIPSIRLIYLFGSRVDGSIGPMSDVDLAVLLEHGAYTFDLQALIHHRLQQMIDEAPVDLIVLNRAPIELAYAVIAEGTILYEQNLLTRVEYEAQVMSRYGDYLPVLRAQRRDILEGGRGAKRVQRYRAALRRTERTLDELRGRDSEDD